MKRSLLPSFLRYMESSQHLVLYRLDSTYSIPSTFFMPHVTTMTIIDCEPDIVSSVLYRPYFPHLQRIHYLSRPPSDPFIHKRFCHLGFMGWVFPLLSQFYPFYDTMTEAGWGRKENGLVSQYLVTQRGSFSSEKPFFDLYLPEYGIVSGEFYKEQQYAYFQKKQCDVRFEDMTIPSRLTTHTVSDSRWVYQQSCLTRAFEKHVLNLPDATPYHNSNK